MKPNISVEELLKLDWDHRTVEFCEYLRSQYGDCVAENYLRVSHQITVDPRPLRELDVIVDPFAEERTRYSPVALQPLATRAAKMGKGEAYRDAIDGFVMGILHPGQLPMRWNDVEPFFYNEGIEIKCSRNTVRSILDRLAEKELLKKLANPYRGNTFLYCNSEFKTQAQVGDRVIELVRRRGSRSGTVTKFKTYRDQNKYPVVLWEYSILKQKPLAVPFETFANPESIVVIERPKGAA